MAHTRRGFSGKWAQQVIGNYLQAESGRCCLIDYWWDHPIAGRVGHTVGLRLPGQGKQGLFFDANRGQFEGDDLAASLPHVFLPKRRQNPPPPPPPYRPLEPPLYGHLGYFDDDIVEGCIRLVTTDLKAFHATCPSRNAGDQPHSVEKQVRRPGSTPIWANC